VNKAGLVDEVKDRLDVSRRLAKELVDAVLEEMRSAVAEGQSLTLRGLGFTPDEELRKVWSQATERPDSPAPVQAPTQPETVPYEPQPDPDGDALAAVAAEQSRPVQPAVDTDGPLVRGMPEPELVTEPDTLAYSSGDATTDETIGELTAAD